MHIIKLFNIKEILIIIVVNILFPPISFTMDAKHTFDESSRRNWRESLNIYDNKGENLVFNTDDWFNGTLDYINEDNELNIRSKFERESPNQSNISLARFTVICHVEDEIIYIPFDLGKIFVSGSNALNRDDSIVKEQGLLEKTVFPISFIDGPRPKGSVLNKNLQSKIKEVTGQVVKDATHSEGSLLIYLFKHLNVYLGEKIETTKNPLIIGSILEISNLKDSCSEFCIPMLETFMINLLVHS